MRTNEKASLQVLKIALITLILIFTCSIVVRAFSMNLNTVKIVLANNYEMNVVTTKTKIADILNENHIVVLPNEVVFPNTDLEIGDDKTIIITAGNNQSVIKESSEIQEAITLEQVLGNYSTIIEKIEKTQETIPYETITKNASSVSSNDRTNQVIQQGKDGIKEITYKVKYQNDIEISRTVISEKIIKKAVNKIVQVTTTTSRGYSNERYGSTSVAEASMNSSSLAKKVAGITPIIKTLNTSAYTASTCDKKITDKGYGITASGAKVKSWYTVAAGKGYPMGTVIYIPALKDKPNGGWFVVQDRGGAISNSKLDIYMSTYNECIQFGRKNLECYIYIIK